MHVAKGWYNNSEKNRVQVIEEGSNVLQLFENKKFGSSEYFTVNQIASRLNISAKFLYEQIASKKLRGTKVGRVWRIEESEVEAWLSRQQKGG